MSFKFTDFSKRLYNLYSPYFGWGKETRSRNLYAIGIIVCNFISVVLLTFLNTAMTALFGVLESPGVTWAGFLGATGVCFAHIAVFCVFATIKSKLIVSLSRSLSNAVNESLLKEWINSKAYYGLKFLPQSKRVDQHGQEIELNPAQIIAYDHTELLDNVTTLVDDFFDVTCLFIVGLISLYYLSVPLSLTFFGFSFTTTGHMALGTLVYSLFYNFITNRMGHPLKSAESNVKKEQGLLYRKSHDLVSHAEPVAFLKGTEHEFTSIKDTLLNINTYRDVANNIKRKLYLATSFHTSIGSYFFPLFLAAPSIIAKKMTTAALYETLQSFQSVVNFFTWKNENLAVLTTSEVALNRIEKFKTLLKEHEKQLSASLPNMPVKVNHKIKTPNIIEFKNLTILNAEGITMLHNVNFSLKKGEATLIKAPSGAGKSTLLRGIAGLWYYMKKGGTIEFSGDTLNIEFIPQNAFVYHMGNSLLDTILYPSKEVANADKINEIKRLMKDVDLKQDIIDELKSTTIDWATKLSGGEKQRIAVISAILKRPDVLFMDEVTSALDTNVKKKVEALLKKELLEKGCAIGFTDHNPTTQPRRRVYTPARNSFQNQTLDLGPMIPPEVREEIKRKAASPAA